MSLPENKKWLGFRRMSRGADGKIKDSVEDILSAGLYWVESAVVAATPEGVEVVGDGHANGTCICRLSIPAYKIFECTELIASSNLPAIIRIGYGTWVSTGGIGPTITGIFHLVDCFSAQGVTLLTEKIPIFEYDNSASAASVTLLMFAPLTAMGLATNNDANHYFNGKIGGIVY